MTEDDDMNALNICVSVWDEEEQLPQLITTLEEKAMKSQTQTTTEDDTDPPLKIRLEIRGTGGCLDSNEHENQAMAKASKNWPRFYQLLNILANTERVVVSKPLVIQFSSPPPTKEQDNDDDDVGENNDASDTKESYSYQRDFDAVTQITANLGRSLSLKVTLDEQRNNKAFVQSLTEFLRNSTVFVYNLSLTFRGNGAGNSHTNTSTTLEPQVLKKFSSALLGVCKLDIHLPTKSDGNTDPPTHQEANNALSRSGQAPLAVTFFRYLAKAWKNPCTPANNYERHGSFLRRIVLHRHSSKNADTVAEAAIQAFFHMFQQSHNTMHWLSVETAPPCDNPKGCTMMEGFSCPYRKHHVGRLFWMKDDKKTKADLKLTIYGWPCNNHGGCPLERTICNELQHFAPLQDDDDDEDEADDVDSDYDDDVDSDAAVCRVGGNAYKTLKHLDLFFGRSTPSQVLHRLLHDALGTNKILHEQLQTLSLGISHPSSSRLQYLFSCLVDLIPKMTCLRELTARPIFAVHLALLPLPNYDHENLRRFPTELQTRLLDSLRENSSIERFDCSTTVLRDSSNCNASSALKTVSKIRLIGRRNKLRKLINSITPLGSTQHQRTSNMGRDPPMALLPQVIEAVHGNPECREEQFTLIFNALQTTLPHIEPES